MSLEDFHDYHKGDPFVVVGCGPSAAGWKTPGEAWTIGVTDCERHIDGTVDYLLISDLPVRFFGDAQWKGDEPERRLRAIAKTQARSVFVPRDERFVKWNEIIDGASPICPFWFSSDGDTSRCDGEHLGFSKTSVYPAVLLAEYMGASRIGMIGNDMTDHPNLNWRLPLLNRHFSALRDALSTRGVELWNLSNQSAIEESSVPRCSTEEFALARQR